MHIVSIDMGTRNLAIWRGFLACPWVPAPRTFPLEQERVTDPDISIHALRGKSLHLRTEEWTLIDLLEDCRVPEDRRDKIDGKVDALQQKLPQIVAGWREKGVETVLIEAQLTNLRGAQMGAGITAGNLTMKILSHIIQYQVRLFEDWRPALHFVNGSATRAVCDDVAAMPLWPAGLEHPAPRAKIAKRIKKKFAVHTTKVLLEQCAPGAAHWRAFFEGHKKKDDLSDSLLQAIAWRRAQKQEKPAKIRRVDLALTLKSAGITGYSGWTLDAMHAYAESNALPLQRAPAASSRTKKRAATVEEKENEGVTKRSRVQTA